MKGRPTA